MVGGLGQKGGVDDVRNMFYDSTERRDVALTLHLCICHQHHLIFFGVSSIVSLDSSAPYRGT